MTLQQIHYALTIAETKSMSKASERLFVSQPTLTKSIKELEQSIGITIFNRTGKGVEITNNGEEFLAHARQIYQQYELLEQKYSSYDNIKLKCGVSSQHYSFAVKAFVETVKHFDIAQYEFAIRETKTYEVIEDVGTSRSEIGIIFISDFNKKILKKIFDEFGLVFHGLVECKAYVYVWKGHPLAGNKFITLDELEKYPCLSFEQGSKGSVYLAEEILSEREYPRTIKAGDRATMLNLMVGLNGYTLCSGIICEELNGSDYVAVPFESGEGSEIMNIGYIVKKNNMLSEVGKLYIDELKKYLSCR
ncbi:MAG: LysR family transcriptional regulator [Oscillospiraceae bacterium]|nr:LysR family transcriptional regulator [Oscillospiraceae bacterium]